MNKLMLMPNRENYSFMLGQSVITTETQEGMPRQRLSSVGTTHRVTAKYECTKAQWQYMLSFLRANRAKPFLAYLLLDDIEPAWYECRAIPDEAGLQASTMHEVLFTLELPLIAWSKPINIGQDEALIALYAMTKAEQDAYFNQLEKLVNADLPTATRGLA